ncbi:DUF7281 domain-containing protein [Photobacterium angustum]|uniref:DUF7281 domain-containing protein n=1 Tax=Photobacterium angustum TaxID=661 RepID=A0A2S7VJL3_PHOAN|nr:hypothetical protein [Photobacterium angustum]PQJ62248.1 hypothetical protein BTO08_18580 [Photobacterium angustum]
MTLSLSLINAAKKIVVNSRERIPANKSNTEACRLVEVGAVSGNSILLSRSDLREIEKYFSSILGQNLLTFQQSSSNSRMDTARPGISEKSAKGGVFQQLISLAGNVNIPLKNQPDVPKEARYVASVELDDLDFPRFSRVLIIENGELMVRWKEAVLSLPDEWQSTVLVYRGHGKNQKCLRALIEYFDNNAVEVGFFYDYDPAGLDMVEQLSNAKHYWVVPAVNLELFQSINKLDAFWKQLEQLERLKSRNVSVSIREHLTIIEKNTLAITQEHLIKNQCPLVIERLIE